MPSLPNSLFTGFNHGYIIAKYEPELAQALLSAIHKERDIPYHQGFVSGIKELGLEREKMKISEELEKLRDQEQPGRDEKNTNRDLGVEF